MKIEVIEDYNEYAQADVYRINASSEEAEVKILVYEFGLVEFQSKNIDKNYTELIEAVRNSDELAKVISNIDNSGTFNDLVKHQLLEHTTALDKVLDSRV